MTSAVFAALALVLAGPAPAVLARMTWTCRVPRAALVLWQSLALAAVLAALSAGVAASVSFVDGGEPTRRHIAGHVIVFALTAIVAARLLWAAVRIAISTRRRRHRHRALVDLVGRVDTRIPGLRVLDDHQPVAYCLPGARESRVVVSAGALDELTARELHAVLEHECAHLRARHDLLLEMFTALHAAFPRVVTSRLALQSVRTLVEMLADDAAVRRAGKLPLARALVTLGSSRVPAAALGFGAGTDATLARLRRLTLPRDGNRALAAATYTLAILIFGAPTVAVAVPWLAALWAAWQR